MLIPLIIAIWFGVKAHRAGKDGEWRDLQLPLYAGLTAELEMESMPELGYRTKVRRQMGSRPQHWAGRQMTC